MGDFHRLCTSIVLAAAIAGVGCRSKTQDTAGSAVTTKPSPAATAGGSAAPAPDPRIAAVSAEERRTCGIYASCKVEGLRDDDPQAPAKEPRFEQECLKVWVTLSAEDKKKIADCADQVGQCMGPPECFDSMKLGD